MAKYDFYKKRGNLNYKERSMLEEISAKIEGNPELAKDIIPANNFDDLKSLHMQVTSQVAEVVSETIEDTLPTAKGETKKPFLDPMNREEPNVRDYVLEDKFDPFADYNKSQKSRSDYAEPQNYGDAFNLPDEDEMQNNKSTSPKTTKSNVRQDADENTTSPNARKKTKRFAESIVITVCKLLEFGFVWFATKDINENKLAEYELTGEMDLSLLIDLPNGMEVTIKEFFLDQLGAIEIASKVDEETKQRVTESLTEVLLEKNFTPSANWNLAIDGLTGLAEQGLKLMVIVQQNNSILSQLRERGGNGPRSRNTQTPPPPQREQQQQDSEYNREQRAQAKREQMKSVRDELLTQQLESEYFEIEPSESIISKASEDILLSDVSLEEEMSNDLSLLEEFETKE